MATVRQVGPPRSGARAYIGVRGELSGHPVRLHERPSQSGSELWVSVAECKVIPVYCHQMSQTIRAPQLPSQQFSPQHRTRHARGSADC